MEDCLFCKIIAGQVPGDKVYEDEFVYAFRDIDPQAPTHVLIVPKEHMQDMMDPRAPQAVAHMVKAAQIIAQSEQLHQAGFRAVLNTGEDGGQSVLHLHMHLLGGRSLQWPPG